MYPYWPCCNNIVVPSNPCIGSSPCIQNYNARCVVYNGTLPCIAGTNPTLDVILQNYCSAFLTIGAEITTLTAAVPISTKIIVTSAQLLTSYSAPTTIIPAPGAGKFIQLLSVYAIFTVGNDYYNLNGNSYIYIGPYQLGDWATVFSLSAYVVSIDPAHSAYAVGSALPAADASGTTSFINQPIVFSTDVANYTTGSGGQLALYITYQIITA